jgi:nifR3 family TIM-barrel protein
MKSSHVHMQRLFSSGVCLAPLAGYTDAPFRLLCFEFGADFAVTEMVSADGLVRKSARTEKFLEVFSGEGPVGVQLFGSDPGIMADAAEIVSRSNASFLDLNFGCPVKKVIRKNGGAALMRDLDLMGRICEEVVRRSELPVTAKIRSGWNRNEENYLDAGAVIERAGISAITLHPRFRSQGFSGSADWDHIRRLREAVAIPVIANGDVTCIDEFRRITAEAGDGAVMIGRGALGRPWIFSEIKHMLYGKDPFEMDAGGRIDILARHVEMEIESKGQRTGLLEMRKFYRNYLKGLPGIKEYRHRLSTAATQQEVAALLGILREELKKTWMKPA